MKCGILYTSFSKFENTKSMAYFGKNAFNSASSFNQLVGVIGGTGPEATTYFTSLLVKLRGHVKRDQEHIPFLVYNNPQIPDRSRYLLYGGEYPLPEMIRSGLVLKKAGATFLVIPCNTAHAFVEELAHEVKLPVISMVEESAKYIAAKYGDDVKVGLLATTGTVKTNIYQQVFFKVAPKISVLVPDQESQAEVMKACYDIKKFSVDEESYELLHKAAKKLMIQGAQVIILGCTEIPLALTKQKCDFNRVDPMEVLAKKVLEQTLASQVSIYRKLLNRFQLPLQQTK